MTTLNWVGHELGWTWHNRFHQTANTNLFIACKNKAFHLRVRDRTTILSV